MSNSHFLPNKNLLGYYTSDNKWKNTIVTYKPPLASTPCFPGIWVLSNFEFKNICCFSIEESEPNDKSLVYKHCLSFKFAPHWLLDVFGALAKDLVISAFNKELQLIDLKRMIVDLQRTNKMKSSVSIELHFVSTN